MTHVMIDLETLGTTADAVILTIGAIAFDPQTFDSVDQFYHRVTIDSQHSNRIINSDTLSWWMEQNDTARHEAFSSQLERVPLDHSLISFKAWLPGNVGGVWGNGADFDNAILQHAADQLGLKLWPYWANRCFRTFTALYDPEKRFRPAENDHNALSDCANQILWMEAIVREEGVQLS